MQTMNFSPSVNLSHSVVYFKTLKPKRILIKLKKSNEKSFTEISDVFRLLRFPISDKLS